MTCPFCNKSMIPGFIQARAEVYFTQNPHKVLFSAKKDETILTRYRGSDPI